jgi:hypothetical protein
VENAFGILSSRFRVLRNPILQSYKNSISTVKATVVLHNYIIQRLNKDNRYFNPASLCREDGNGGITPAAWEQEASNNLWPLQHLAGNHTGTKVAKDQRDFMAYTMLTDELVPWQFQNAFRTS